MRHVRSYRVRAVQSISLPYIFKLAIALNGLTRLPLGGAKYGDVSGLLNEAFLALLGINEPGSLYGSHLRSSLFGAGRLLKLLRPIIEQQDIHQDIPPATMAEIVHAYSEYEIALLAEIHIFNAYFVTRKDPYDTNSLLFSGESLFPAELLSKAPDAVFDTQEAAKCLAYELPTACGFHAFRATEAVLRRYHMHVTGVKVPPKQRNWGAYIRAMEGTGNEKLLSCLKQLKDLHRNPLIHPEARLSTEEAIDILGLARSAVGVMLSALPVLPLTTANPPPSLPSP